ncbi:MAG: pilin [bacterium]|nr:pilin [bacterium]
MLRRLLTLAVIASLATLVVAPLAVWAQGVDTDRKRATVAVQNTEGEWVNASEPTGQCRARFDAPTEENPRPILFTSANCFCYGNCVLADFVVIVVQVSKFIFGISGSLALLMFTIGGFLWVTSAGSAEQVKKGRETLVHATIGIVIIFGAWLLVNTILGALTGQLGATTPAKLFTGDWAVEWSTLPKTE